MTPRMLDNAVRRGRLRQASWPAGGRVFLVGLLLTLCLMWWVAQE